MTIWFGFALDIVLIILVGIGIAQATRLIRQLATLRESRTEMGVFVRDFNATVMRAEAGIKGLRQAARDSGDDLERLVEKGNSLRDELQFIVESADQIAERLSQGAQSAIRPVPAQEKQSSNNRPNDPAAPSNGAKNAGEAAQNIPSRAERELMQALEKLG